MFNSGRWLVNVKFKQYSIQLFNLIVFSFIQSAMLKCICCCTFSNQPSCLEKSWSLIPLSWTWMSLWACLYCQPSFSVLSPIQVGRYRQAKQVRVQVWNTWLCFFFFLVTQYPLQLVQWHMMLQLSLSLLRTSHLCGSYHTYRVINLYDSHDCWIWRSCFGFKDVHVHVAHPNMAFVSILFQECTLLVYT